MRGIAPAFHDDLAFGVLADALDNILRRGIPPERDLVIECRQEKIAKRIDRLEPVTRNSGILPDTQPQVRVEGDPSAILPAATEIIEQTVTRRIVEDGERDA